MSTIVSTTPLTTAESTLLTQSHSATGDLAVAQAQITKWQKKLAAAQKAAAAATTACQATYKSVLASKLPTPVPVPAGATITRVTVNGVDSLRVTTP